MTWSSDINLRSNIVSETAQVSQTMQVYLDLFECITGHCALPYLDLKKTKALFTVLTVLSEGWQPKEVDNLYILHRTARVLKEYVQIQCVL